MFIDEAEIYIKAGNGGDGAVSFRRERFVPRGGPDGGDGGDGGDMIFRADNHQHGLALFNREKRFLAENGHNGMGKKKSGKNGVDLILQVPLGTQIYNKDEMLVDLIKEDEPYKILNGGQGGWGNHHFATSIKQAPRWSKKGLRGEGMKVRLELKTIADIGIIGLPNAGKSTLLSVLSNAKPKIADYPFTTLEPNLGAIKNIEKNIIMADIPGLIEGAAKGKGLGDKFLRHIERTKVILHIIDASSPNIIGDYKVIRKELLEYSKKLSKKKEVVVLNKIELIPEKELDKKIKTLKKNKIGLVVTVSAAAHKNLPVLIETILRTI